MPDVSKIWFKVIFRVNWKCCLVTNIKTLWLAELIGCFPWTDYCQLTVLGNLHFILFGQVIYIQVSLPAPNLAHSVSSFLSVECSFCFFRICSLFVLFARILLVIVPLLCAILRELCTLWLFLTKGLFDLFSTTFVCSCLRVLKKQSAHRYLWIVVHVVHWRCGCFYLHCTSSCEETHGSVKGRQYLAFARSGVHEQHHNANGYLQNAAQCLECPPRPSVYVLHIRINTKHTGSSIYC